MPKRIDQNQIEIVRTLRDVGISVAITANQGGGFPDLVTGGLISAESLKNIVDEFIEAHTVVWSYGVPFWKVEKMK